MTITAKIKLDSVSEQMVRLPTFETRFPRLILPEVLTHRVFSRNASSSRAIPVKRIMQDVIDDPAIPVKFGKNQRGMQAGGAHTAEVFLNQWRQESVEYFDDADVFKQLYHRVEQGFDHQSAWLKARDYALEVAAAFDAAGYHKEVVNRILEPYVHTNMVISTTHMSNFRNLRMAEDAQPDIQVLSKVMNDALYQSTPTLIPFGEWHLPYTTEDERLGTSKVVLRKVASARLARVSYNNHDGSSAGFQEDIERFQKLLNPGGTIHGSVFEHIATPVPNHKGSNFYGWMQWRELLAPAHPFNEFYDGAYYVSRT